MKGISSSLRTETAPGFDGLLHKGDQTLGRSVGYTSHPDPPDALSIFLSRHHDQRFFGGLTASGASLRTAQKGFVHLHSTRPAGLVQVSPWRASAYAAKPRPSDSCPSPGCRGGPAHFHRSSGWSRTTSPETRLATASACLRESCRRSARSAVDKRRIGAHPSPSSRPFLRRTPGTGSRPATEASGET